MSAGLPASPDSATRRMAALVLAAVALAYLPSATGEFLWDDHVLIVANPDVHEAARLPRALVSNFWSSGGGGGEVRNRITVYFRPVITLANFLLWKVGGGSPVPFHLANVALHLGCVALLAGLLRRRLGAASGPFAWAAAGLFALFPARAESVGWVSGATDLFAALFVLLGMAAFDRLRGAWRVAAASAAFVLGLYSKESAIVAPLLLLLDGALLGPGGLRARLATFVPVVAALGLRALVVPASPSLLAEGWADLLRVPSSLGLYLARTLWPWNPSLLLASRFRNENGGFDYSSWSIALGVAFALAIVAAAAVAVRRQAARPWFADLAWFVLPLAPVLNLVPTNVTNLIAERNLYLPHLGLFALVARAAMAVPLVRRRLLVPLGAAAALAFASATVPHVLRLADPEEIWAYEEALHPDDLALLGFKARIHERFARPKDAAHYQARIFAAQRFPPDRAATAAGLLTLAATSETDPAKLGALAQFIDGLGAPNGPQSLEILGTAVPLGADPRIRATLAANPAVAEAARVARSKSR